MHQGQFELLLDLGTVLLKMQKDLINLEVREKPEAGGPVSKADLYADAWLKEFLPTLLPGDCYSEEDHPFEIDKENSSFWLIDPIDGTKDFISGGEDFCVCGVFFKKAIPQMSIIYAPAFSEVFWAKIGEGANLWNPNSMKKIYSTDRKVASLRQAIVLESKSNPIKKTQEYMQKLDLINRVSMGSALKFCRIAEGKGDVSFRFSRSWDWDVAPGHLILKESGGELLPLLGAEAIEYCTESRKVVPFAAVSGSARNLVEPLLKKMIQ
jgi:3'(2'), 5'-bisphosphate nucleotidase